MGNIVHNYQGMYDPDLNDPFYFPNKFEITEEQYTMIKTYLENYGPGRQIIKDVTEDKYYIFADESEEAVTERVSALLAEQGQVYPVPVPPAPVILTVDVNIGASVDILGKVVSDLQTGITVGTDAITGTLKYVTGYTGFDADPELQEGNYLAIHCTSTTEDDITVELLEGYSGPITLDEDGIVVLRIADKDTQSVKVTCGNEVKTFSLTGLTCEQDTE